MWGASDQEAIDNARRPEVVALGLGSDGPLCRIPVKGYQTLDFDMDEDRMATLIKSGKSTMESIPGGRCVPPPTTSIAARRCEKRHAAGREGLIAAYPLRFSLQVGPMSE